MFKNIKVLESITFNSWPIINYNSFNNISVSEININYNNKHLSIKIDKDYYLKNLYNNGDNYVIICENNPLKLDIYIDKNLNKKEELTLKGFIPELIDDKTFTLDTKYDKFNILYNSNVAIKSLDFSNFKDKKIDFNLMHTNSYLDKIILPEINPNNDVSINFNNKANIKKIVIKNNNINRLDNNELSFVIENPYHVNSIKIIKDYYVFNLSSNKNDYSIIVDKENNVINLYNLTVNDELSLDFALKSYYSNNNTKLNNILNKYNISPNVLQEIFDVIMKQINNENKIEDISDNNKVKIINKVKKNRCKE